MNGIRWSVLQKTQSARRKLVEEMTHRKIKRIHRTSMIVNPRKIIVMAILLFTLLLSARARCISWKVNFVQSKDAQKQLA